MGAKFSSDIFAIHFVLQDALQTGQQEQAAMVKMDSFPWSEG